MDKAMMVSGKFVYRNQERRSNVDSNKCFVVKGMDYLIQYIQWIQ